MNPNIIDGKAYADSLCARLRSVVFEQVANNREPPKLVIVTTGNNFSGMTYLNNKIKRCMEIGIDVSHLHFNALTKNDIAYIAGYRCPTIFQLPLVTKDAFNVRSEIRGVFQHPKYDVDGFGSIRNVANLYTSGIETPQHYPCTPYGIIRLMEHHGIRMEGKTACVIGRSDIVGRPVAQMLENHDATVIHCHSHTPRDILMHMIDISDIVVSAVGCANFITEYDLCSIGRGRRMDLSQKTIIDVGINRDENGKLCGDIPECIKERAYAYTPVPGGIGPVTVAMLMRNVVQVWLQENGLTGVKI